MVRAIWAKEMDILADWLVDKICGSSCPVAPSGFKRSLWLTEQNCIFQHLLMSGLLEIIRDLLRRKKLWFQFKRAVAQNPLPPACRLQESLTAWPQIPFISLVPAIITSINNIPIIVHTPFKYLPVVIKNQWSTLPPTTCLSSLSLQTFSPPWYLAAESGAR